MADEEKEQPGRQDSHRTTRSRMKRTMVAGLLTLVPVAATFVVLKWVLVWMDSIAAPVIRGMLGLHLPGLGILLTLALVYLVGFLAKSVFGKRGIDWGESMLMRLPIVKIVYNPVKKLLGTWAMSQDTQMWKTVLVEYPRRGTWMIAFVAGEIPGAPDEMGMLSVFVPNTPNPAAGRVIIVPREDVRYINVPMDDAIEFVVSGGTAIAPTFMLPPQLNRSNDNSDDNVTIKAPPIAPPQIISGLEEHKKA